MTNNQIFNLIKDYLFAFKTNEQAIEIIFPKGLDYYKTISEDELKDEITRNIIIYFNNEFTNGNLTNLFIESINKNKIKKTFSLFNSLILNTKYEITYEDVFGLYSIDKVKKYLKSTKEKNQLITQINEFMEDLEDIEDNSQTKQIIIPKNTSDNYSLFMQDINDYDVMSREEEQEVLKKYKEENDKEAFDRLVLCNQRLVIRIARRYQGRGLPLLDLIQEGNFGLMTAINKYDINTGYKLSTSAVFWIRQAIKKAIYDKGKTIRISVHMIEIKEKITREENQYQTKYGKEPTIEELSELTGYTKEQILDSKKYDIQMVSFDKPVQTEEDNGTTLGDFIKSDIEGPEVQIEKDYDKKILDNLLKRLSKDPQVHDSYRMEQIIRLRYGVELYNGETYKLLIEKNMPVNDKGYILSDVGKIFGITRERVRQLENKALKKLKLYAIAMGYEDLFATEEDKQVKKKVKTTKKSNKTEDEKHE